MQFSHIKTELKRNHEGQEERRNPYRRLIPLKPSFNITPLVPQVQGTFSPIGISIQKDQKCLCDYIKILAVTFNKDDLCINSKEVLRCLFPDSGKVLLELPFTKGLFLLKKSMFVVTSQGEQIKNSSHLAKQGGSCCSKKEQSSHFAMFLLVFHF